MIVLCIRFQLRTFTQDSCATKCDHKFHESVCTLVFTEFPAYTYTYNFPLHKHDYYYCTKTTSVECQKFTTILLLWINILVVLCVKRYALFLLLCKEIDGQRSQYKRPQKTVLLIAAIAIASNTPKKKLKFVNCILLLALSVSSKFGTFVSESRLKTINTIIKKLT